MRSCTLVLSMLLVCTAAVGFAQAVPLLEDGFDGPTVDTSKWDILGSAAIDNSKGNPASCVHTWGSYPGGWVRSKQTFDYVGRNLELSADINADGWSSDIELMRSDCPNRALAVIGLTGSQYTEGYRNTVNFQIWDSTGHTNNSGIIAFPNADGWHNGKISVRSNGYVDFYIDGALLWTSTNTISTAYGTANFMLGGWDDYYDNALVAVPEPATLTLLALGGLALIRRKQQ